MYNLLVQLFLPISDSAELVSSLATNSFDLIDRFQQNYNVTDTFQVIYDVTVNTIQCWNQHTLCRLIINWHTMMQISKQSLAELAVMSSGIKCADYAYHKQADIYKTAL